MAREYTSEEHQAWLKGLPSIPAGATMMLEDPSGRLLLVKADYRRYWTPPGGVVDAGESPKQAAIRETSEEVGLTIQPNTVRFMGVAYRKSSTFLDTYQFIFGASLSQERAEAIILGESEIEDHAFVTKEQVLSGDRAYSQVVVNWANEAVTHYDEQISA